jgi:hypothetical protein
MKSMMFANVVAVLTIAGAATNVQASIVGQANRAYVRVGTYYRDSNTGAMVEVDSRQLYSFTAFTFGGPAVVMDAQHAGTNDLLLQTSVSDVGDRRTVSFSMSTLSGGAMMDQIFVNTLVKSERYFVYFGMADGSPTDNQKISAHDFEVVLLGTGGEEDVWTGTLSGSLPDKTGYFDVDSPAGPNFLDLTPRGFRMTLAYDIIPSPATAAILACGTVLMPRRRR